MLNKNTVQAPLLLYSLNPKFCTGIRQNCSLHQFRVLLQLLGTGSLGTKLCPWSPLRDSPPLERLARSRFRKLSIYPLWIPSIIKSVGTPMRGECSTAKCRKQTIQHVASVSGISSPDSLPGTTCTPNTWLATVLFKNCWIRPGADWIFKLALAN